MRLISLPMSLHEHCINEYTDYGEPVKGITRDGRILEARLLYQSPEDALNSYGDHGSAEELI